MVCLLFLLVLNICVSVSYNAFVFLLLCACVLLTSNFCTVNCVVDADAKCWIYLCVCVFGTVQELDEVLVDTIYF